MQGNVFIEMDIRQSEGIWSPKCIALQFAVFGRAMLK
jgi:hypothetical protein